MAGDRVTAPGATGSRAMNDIRKRSIGLDEIKVSGGNVAQFMTKVAHQRHAFQKHFRLSYRRPDVEINSTPIHLAHNFGQEPEVGVRGRA